MGKPRTIDTSGLSCPQPALLTHQTLPELKEGILLVIVDNNTARENVSRAARNLGWEVAITKQAGDTCHIEMRR